LQQHTIIELNLCVAALLIHIIFDPLRFVEYFTYILLQKMDRRMDGESLLHLLLQSLLHQPLMILMMIDLSLRTVFLKCLKSSSCTRRLYTYHSNNTTSAAIILRS
jgi:hypothetical protein